MLIVLSVVLGVIGSLVRVFATRAKDVSRAKRRKLLYVSLGLIGVTAVLVMVEIAEIISHLMR